jgi:drug/metabolite transporter (DMT)-like permease
LRGVLAVLGAVLFFACSDAAAKSLMESMPANQVTWIRFVVFALMMLPVLAVKGPAAWRSRQPGLQVARALGAMVSAILFIAALRVLPLAETTAMAFASPLFVTALSVPFLGERVGPRRWAAVVVGLMGVLIVVRPGSDAFDPAAFLPLVAAAIWAASLVITRLTSGADHPLVTLTYTALVGCASATLTLPFAWAEMGWHEVGLGLLTGVTATVAQGLIVLAYHYASASLLSPFFYSQLVWSAALGFFVFGHVPDGWSFVGAAVIIASGLYTANRERLRAKTGA